MFCAAAFFAAAFTIISCGGDKTKSGSGDLNLSFDSVVVDTTAALTKDANSPSCELHISMMYAKGEKADSLNEAIIHSGILTPDYLGLVSGKMTIPEAVDSFKTKYIADYRKVFGDIYRQDPKSASLNTQYRVATKVEDGRDGVVTYIADVYQYEGGAHGSSITVVKNIDPKSGKILTLKDVFVPGGDVHVKEMIIKELEKKAKVESLDELQKAGYFMDITPYITENFILGKDDITFIYCEDEIGPHALGEIRVVLDYSDLESYLK